ncbi:MAG: hypothetical protein GY757_54305 [bacterium]|nr:hypothetical protein [bacterium]
MKSIRSMLIAIAVFMFFCAEQANACPACNIHNYLAKSVRNSTKIFHGKVIRQINKYKADVEVLKVLRGKVRVRSRVQCRMYNSKEYTGQKFIFSNPISREPMFGASPTFEVLHLEYEDEVLFLMKKKPAVKNLKEAVKRVQGVSVMTQDIGMKYLTAHYDKAKAPLVTELERLMPEVFSGKDIFYGEHRLGKLLEALLLRESQHAKEFTFSYIDQLTKLKGESIDWASFPYKASARGVFLRDLLKHSQKHKELAAALRTRLQAILPKLSGSTLADCVYAVAASKTETADGVCKLMSEDASADMFALGLFFAGNYNSRWWAHKEAKEFWNKALSITKQKELKSAILKRTKRR